MKQAVVIIHGMGEQVPMETLTSFVEATWVHDANLIDKGRPDTMTGGTRTKNAVWSKPDSRNRSFELRRMVTESLGDRGPTDFYEFYWAHLMEGTTWEHLKAWLGDLLWRSPKRVPAPVFTAWLFLWALTLVIAAGAMVLVVPVGTLRACLIDGCSPASQPSGFLWVVVIPIATAIASAVIAALTNTFLLKYFGDVARYVRAAPPNVARRQEIREHGVELLETLMGRNRDGTFKPSPYDRIVVVAHSLGSIVAYDVLTHCFARMNTIVREGAGVQPEREKLEGMLRDATARSNTVDSNSSDEALNLTDYQAQQERCRLELNDQGNPWIVSDFVTLGSPLTHAEFLLSKSKQHLLEQQAQRIFPTCPPALEYDGTTKAHHFTFRRPKKTHDADDVMRVPHHAALFAYTRWTNLHSPHRAIFWGDIISGPLSRAFGLTTEKGTLRGIKDIAVLEKDDARRDRFSRFFTHTKYWEFDPKGPLQRHIETLRKVLRLGGGR